MRSTREQGALLVELVIGVVLLSIVAVAIVATMGNASKLEVGNQARNRLSATAESLTERLRSDTTWMKRPECEATLGTSSTCNVSWMFDGSGSAPYNVADPNLNHPDYGQINVVATARAADTADDGIGPADQDQQRIDVYHARVQVEFADAARLGANLAPVVVETTIDPSSARATGSLAVQVCRIRDQADERLAIRECNSARQVRMAPPARWDAATGGTTPDAQAYTCAHPGHYRASTTQPFVNAAETGPGVANTKCHTADGPYAASTVPSYFPLADLFGTPWYDYMPKFSPRSTNLPSNISSTSWDDRYRYVSTVIEPVVNRSVTINGFAGTATSGETRTGVTDAQGMVRWSDLVPGRYSMTVGGMPTSVVRSDELSVPGDSVTVAQGIESKATQVYLPKATHDVRISLRTVDTSWPWTSLQTGWRVFGGRRADGKPYVLKPWNPAWGNQWGGVGAPYVSHYGMAYNWDPAAGPGPWPNFRTYSDWMVNNTDGSPQPLCVALRPAPYGRLVRAPEPICRHQPVTTQYAFTGLAPGLYSYEVTGVPGMVWREENSPGFIWVDENGATLPPSGGAWSAQARATYYGCRDDYRALARWLMDPELPAPPCGAATSSSSGPEGGGGGG